MEALGSRWLTSRALSFPPSLIGQISRLAESQDVVNLSEGFPNFPAPQFLKEAGKIAIDQDRNQYCYVKELCHAISKVRERSYGLETDGGSEVSICCGQSGAFVSAILAVVNPGDEVIIFTPCYETYVPCVTFAGGIPVFANLKEPFWTVTEKILEDAVSEKTKAIIVNSPNNPTGRVLTEEELQIIAQFCCKHDILAITDEVYEHLVFPGHKHISLASLPEMRERTVVTSSISKTFSVTGWRIGWAISPPAICQAIDRIHCKMVDCPPSPFQFAALQALQADPLHFSHLQENYNKKQTFLCQVLSSAGFQVLSPPEGGMFAFVKIPDSFQGIDVDFAKWLIETKRVAVVPGSNFFPNSPQSEEDRAQRHQYVRVAFCKSEETLEKASLFLKNNAPL